MMRRAHLMPFGAEISDAGIRFALWAPTARSVSFGPGGGGRPRGGEDEGGSRLVAAAAGAGQRSAFRADEDLRVPAPASRFQPDDVHGPSLIVDPTAYE